LLLFYYLKYLLGQSLYQSQTLPRAFNGFQIEQLREIASLCPLEKGRAVYAARVLLSYVDNPYRDYTNACELIGAPISNSARMVMNTTSNTEKTKHYVGIYPNPNNGTFTVNVYNNELSTLEITDVIGQTVFIESFKNTKEIKASELLQSGVYLCKVKQNNKVVYQNKLIIKK
jgi:Secretion system C-terminal sorting domain